VNVKREKLMMIDHSGGPWCYLYCTVLAGYSFKFFFFMARQPLVCQGLFIIEALRSHPDTPHPVRLLWTSDRPVA